MAEVMAQEDPAKLSPVRRCPVEPDAALARMAVSAGGCGGGMIPFGWDGIGQNATQLFWHVGGATPDFGSGQRAAIISALQAWADVVQITFIELPVPRQHRSIDFGFFSGDHSAAEPQEAGDPDCAFDGEGGDVLGHAAFPPAAVSLCGGSIFEPFAGNVHFDEDERWEQDDGDPLGFSLTHVACHEIGHALGLMHASEDCLTDVMRPGVGKNDGFEGLSANDIANIRSEYAAGTGSVITLNQNGVWVDKSYSGTELGTQQNPFRTVSQGVSGVPPHSSGVVVHLEAGNYVEVITVGRDMTLRAKNGPVVIGR